MAVRSLRASRSSVVAAALAAFALVLTQTALTQTAGLASDDPSVPQQPNAGVANTYPVTLITGDQVVLNVFANGKQAVTIAERPATSSADGTQPSFHATELDGDVYVWPTDVGIYIDTLLDRELFNVSKLVRQGLADGASTSTPVIVDYGADVTATALPGGIAKTTTLPSIGAVAGQQAKARAPVFGNALDTQLAVDAPAIEMGREDALARTGPFAGIETIYLDERVQAALADSVPQIGAPARYGMPSRRGRASRSTARGTSPSRSSGRSTLRPGTAAGSTSAGVR